MVSFVPNITDGSANVAPKAFEVATASGAIDESKQFVFITKATAAALTITAPDTGTDGWEITIIATTDAAHTVTFATTGFNASTTSGDVATFGGAIGDSMKIVAYNGNWYTTILRNVTLG